jgi:hypothetical protein
MKYSFHIELDSSDIIRKKEDEITLLVKTMQEIEEDIVKEIERKMRKDCKEFKIVYGGRVK